MRTAPDTSSLLSIGHILYIFDVFVDIYTSFFHVIP